jgi:hypothetical protein
MSTNFLLNVDFRSMSVMRLATVTKVVVQVRHKGYCNVSYRCCCQFWMFWSASKLNCQDLNRSMNCSSFLLVFQIHEQVLLSYFSSGTWLTGVAVDVLGGLLMLRAVSQAPVSGPAYSTFLTSWIRLTAILEQFSD